MKLSLALTNYNRTSLIIEAFKEVANDDRISEIVIVDDCSYIDVFEYVKEHTAEFKKVKLFRNEKNIGMAANKAKAVSLCENEWVILFDSDNVIKPDYLDAFFKLEILSDTCIYMPEKALPKYDFTPHSGYFFAGQYIAQRILRDNMLNVCLNTCNYIVNRDFYNKTFRENKAIKGIDTIYHATNHLAAGGCFYIVPEMQYFHRTHDGSEFMKHLSYNMAMANQIKRQLANVKANGMVSCKLKGRFGNHLFTIAAVISHAIDNNTEYHIPADRYFDNLENRLFNPRLPKRIIREMQHNYKPLQRPFIKENTIYDGHYQSEKYFAHNREYILSVFGFEPIKSDKVAIHIRRGDYLQNPDSFPFVGIDYLMKGIEYFKNKGETKFIVFGDDYEWNVQNIKYDGCDFEFRNGDMMQDFLEMAGCKAHIISNSTFSWWAAWIANGEVVAPKVWFGQGAKHLNTSDICPERWIKM